MGRVRAEPVRAGRAEPSRAGPCGLCGARAEWVPGREGAQRGPRAERACKACGPEESVVRGSRAGSCRDILGWAGGEKYRAEERRVLAESVESAKSNVNVFKGFYKYTTFEMQLGRRANLPRCRESDLGEYLYLTFFLVAKTF